MQPQQTVDSFPFKSTKMSIATPRAILRRITVWTSLPWHFSALVRSSEREERGEEAGRAPAAGGHGWPLGMAQRAHSTEDRRVLTFRSYRRAGFGSPALAQGGGKEQKRLFPGARRSAAHLGPPGRRERVRGAGRGGLLKASFWGGGRERRRK